MRDTGPEEVLEYWFYIYSWEPPVGFLICEIKLIITSGLTCKFCVRVKWGNTCRAI